LWAAIVLSIGLLSLAAVQRLRRPNDPSLTWVAVRAALADGGDASLQILELPRDDSGEGVGLQYTADLTPLGAALDDPALGRETLDDGSSDTGSAALPRSKRWRFHFPSGLTEGQYARQLDSLGIELGVFSVDAKIQYVSELAGAEVKSRTAPRGAEKRLYLTWNRGDLHDADLALLERAGIKQPGQFVLHFCPDETVEKLATLEQEFEGRKPAEIQQTVYSIKRTFRGYEVYVKEQTPR
jgi:hypothetical protein